MWQIPSRIRAISTIKNREKVNGDLLKFSAEFLDAVSDLSEDDKQNKQILKSILFKIIREVDGIPKHKGSTFFDFADDYVERRESNQRLLVRLS